MSTDDDATTVEAAFSNRIRDVYAWTAAAANQRRTVGFPMTVQGYLQSRAKCDKNAHKLQRFSFDECLAQVLCIRYSEEMEIFFPCTGLELQLPTDFFHLIREGINLRESASAFRRP